MSRVLAAAVAVGFSLSFGGAAGARAEASLEPEHIQQAVARAVDARHGYRLHFPGEEPPGERRARLPARRGDVDAGSGLAAAPALSLGARMVLWSLAVVAAVLSAVALVRAWRQRGEPAGGPGTPSSVDADTPSSSAPPGLADADALAARGDLAGAIHVLLRHALRRVHGHAEPPPAWTARVALRRLPLDAAQRAHLRVLVEAVEHTRYAGHAPDAETYARCRAASGAL